MQEWTTTAVHHILNEQLSGIVYFYTPICGTCQVAGKMLEVVAETLPNKTFGKINLNFSPELAAAFSIESVPCLLLISKGKVQEKIYAFHSVPFLYEKIKTLY